MIQRILKSRRAEGYIDTAIGVFCLMLVIALIAHIFEHLDYGGVYVSPRHEQLFHPS